MFILNAGGVSQSRWEENHDANGNIELRKGGNTISSGAITFSETYCQLISEHTPSSDDLTTINGGEIGQIIVLRITNSDHQVDVVSLGGNIDIDSNMALNNYYDTMVLMNYDGSNWLELFRSNNS